MKTKRILPLLLALALSLSMAVPASAAIWTTETDHVPVSAGGINYTTWACLYQDTANTFRGTTWVSNTTYTNLPAGYMGLSCYLCNPNGDVYGYTRMNYTVGEIYFHDCLCPSITAGPEGVYTAGEVSLYTGAGYVWYPTPSTVVKYPIVTSAEDIDSAADPLDELALTLASDGGYPVTASGKTYGSALLADLVGESPELVAAVGVDGTRGYVLISDLRPEVNDLGDALEYMEYLESTEDTYNVIPLYDLNENVIGSFHVQLPCRDEETPPEVQQMIDRLNAERSQVAGRQSEAPAQFPQEPIPAIGTQGERGYIHLRDTPIGQWTIQTPEDAVQYTKFLDTLPDSFLIPLYDKDGNVIGRFRMNNCHDSLPEEEIIRQVGVPAFAADPGNGN